ncbi:HNH endonuclease [Silvibacterium bohemicum]|uniref:HNH endonuclease n=1 Tax=Silvibacterium bohemicum TaxID=1577686 RepID=UPI0009E34727
MPVRAKRPCRKAGCAALTDSGYCVDHASLGQQDRKQRERWRGSSSARGYDADWQRVRGQALKRDRYLCQHCQTKQRITAATEVHHLSKIKTHPHLRLMLSNLLSVCHDCHEELEPTA